MKILNKIMENYMGKPTLPMYIDTVYKTDLVDFHSYGQLGKYADDASFDIILKDNKEGGDPYKIVLQSVETGEEIHYGSFPQWKKGKGDTIMLSGVKNKEGVPNESSNKWSTYYDFVIKGEK